MSGRFLRNAARALSAWQEPALHPRSGRDNSHLHVATAASRASQRAPERRVDTDDQVVTPEFLRHRFEIQFDISPAVVAVDAQPAVRIQEFGDRRDSTHCLFSTGLADGVKPLWRNYLSMFETYCNAQQPDKALEFAHRHADSFELSQQACTMLLSTSAAAGNVDVVRHLLRTLMPAHGLVPDRVAFFVAMQKLLAASQPRACLELFELACDNEQAYGVVLDARVINLAIQAHLQLHDERKALELLEHELPKRGLEATIADLNSLLSFYARENRPVEFRLMLAEVHRRKLQPDALTYHLAIAMNTRTGHAHKALEYLARLFADGIRPLEHTWELAFELATQRGDLETFLRTMESFHERVSTTDSHQRVPHNNNLNNHNEPDPKIKKLVTELCTRLLVAYCQGGRTDHAARVLAMMDQANLPFDVDALDFYSRQYYFGARTNDAADDDPW